MINLAPLIQNMWRAKDPNASEVQPLDVPNWWAEQPQRHVSNVASFVEYGAPASPQDNALSALHRGTAEYRTRHADVVRENQRRADLKANWARQAQGVSDEKTYYQNMADQRNEIELTTGRPPSLQALMPPDQRSGSIADSPDWWLQGEPDPREVTAQNLPRIRRNLDRLPPSLRSLYAERFSKP